MHRDERLSPSLLTAVAMPKLCGQPEASRACYSRSKIDVRTLSEAFSDPMITQVSLVVWSCERERETDVVGDLAWHV